MNVVWFVIDTLRSDHLSCYGYFRETSPNIDRLAEEGVLFEDSYASAIPTGPGFTSLFTGLPAINHGFYLTPWNVPNSPLLDDRIPTLPEMVQMRGDYTTAAFDNLINFHSHMKQFVRGFEYYVNITRSPAWLHHHITASEIDHRLLSWLERHAEETFFLFVHYWDPHLPYNMPDKFLRFDKTTRDLAVKRAPDGYDYVPGWGRAEHLPEGDERHSIDLYDDEVFYVDNSVGLVRKKIEDLGLLDDTVIIVTGDHGEDLDLHGLWGHGTVHNTTIQVPFIIRDPSRLPRGKRVAGYVQHVDNVPTILEYFPQQDRPGFGRISMPNLMLAYPTQFGGRSLIKAVRGEASPPGEIVVESNRSRAYLAPPWKLIWYKDGRESELFQLENDPLELNDRAAEERDTRAELSEKLHRWVERNLSDGRPDPIYAHDDVQLDDPSVD